MRIEVLVGNEDPVVYPLNSAKMTVGSAEQCDIVLETNGVSRKHLIILTEGDNYFVVDQGSTNGSFINEDRLVPGRKVEFTSFFPVRLGDNVLLSLLSDEEGEDSLVEKIEIPEKFRELDLDVKAPGPANDRTNVISLKELNKVKTEKLIQTRDQKRTTVKKKIEAPKARPKKKVNLVPYVAFAIVAAAAVYNLFIMKPVVEEPKPLAKVGELVQEKVPPKTPPVNELLVPESELAKRDAYDVIVNDLKCSTDREILFCDLFPGAREEGYGVAQVGLTIHVMVNGATFFEEAKQKLRPPGSDRPEALAAHETDVNDAAAFLYLLKLSKVEGKPDAASLADLRFSIALFRPTENGGRELVRVIALKGNVLPQLTEHVKEESVLFMGQIGIGAINYTKEIYRVY
jgi:pSer/pThr/pTyr-binding forkhead associated (FHA) protein